MDAGCDRGVHTGKAVGVVVERVVDIEVDDLLQGGTGDGGTEYVGEIDENEECGFGTGGGGEGCSLGFECELCEEETIGEHFSQYPLAADIETGQCVG